ncbi:MAG: DNA polymerase III subunit gamma/tau [bacterium]
MGYQVLARKWRPSRFDEMVGQDHVLKALINALDKQRLHHAYLFTGTRGVGKTTIARILARCLNCEEGISSTPCGVCPTCQQIDEGRFVDLIEVDAASRTKVDDTRELLDNVQYKPTVGRYKVYLIDEVHMLSTHSFNALLKTLEEPPPHVVFLLATTDPQKLPVTVLSRCLQFNLKRVSEQQIAAHLADILQRESVTFEPGALNALAEAADGSIRDGMSLLDQAIAFGDGKVTDAETAAMLGSISHEFLHELVQALGEGDPRAAMDVVERMAEFSPDYDAVLAGLISTLHNLALAQQIPEVLESRLSDPQPTVELAKQVAAEDIQLWYEIALHARKDLQLAISPRQGFEMGLLRMLAFRPLADAEPQPVSGSKPMPVMSTPVAGIPPARSSSPPPQQGQPASGGAAPATNNAPAVSPKYMPKETGIESAMVSVGAPDSLPDGMPPEPPPLDVATAPAPSRATASSATAAPAGNDDWSGILPRLGLKSFAQAFASNCTLVACEEGLVTLAVSEHHEVLRNDKVEQKIVEALTTYYGRETRLKIEVQSEISDSPAAQKSRQIKENQLSAEAAIENDPVVQSLANEFDASVVPGSVNPLPSEGG